MQRRNPSVASVRVDNLAAIVNYIFQAETLRLDRAMLVLMEKHTSITGQMLVGFKHAGKNFIPLKYKAVVPAMPGGSKTLPTLSIKISEEVFEFMRDFDKIQADMQKVTQTLAPLIYGLNTLQETRDMLPECVVDLVPSLKELPRTKPDLYLFEDQPLKQAAFQKGFPLIQYYTMTHLMY